MQENTKSQELPKENKLKYPKKDKIKIKLRSRIKKSK
jgi:hypothetical protein